MKLVVTPLPYRQSTSNLIKALQQFGNLVALESAAHSHENGRWSIITASPASTTNQIMFDDSSQAMIEDLIARLPKVKSHLPFIGGVIGHASYGASNNTKLNKLNKASIHASLYTWSFIFDHKNKEVSLTYWTDISTQTQSELIDIYTTARPVTETLLNTTTPFKLTKPFHPRWSKDTYKEKIKRIHSYIRSGDAYQINLTQQFSGQYTGNPVDAYLKLKAQSNSPYLTYFEINNTAFASASPELFIQNKNNLITSKPIKGTIARSKDRLQDAKNITTLKNSPKDKAENLMITDLLRNDLSISCSNTKTPKLFDVESFETVHHLVSTITTEKPSGLSPFSIFRQSFPGGSITGAPKIRAMEIISELEDFSREFYCGSSFYYSANENFSSNILIRSFSFTKGTVNCWAGGGITIDSTWESEYQESLDKISRLMKALEN